MITEQDNGVIYDHQNTLQSRVAKIRRRSMYQYSGQTSIFGVVFFVSKFLLGIERQKKLQKLAILTRKPRSRSRILIY